MNPASPPPDLQKAVRMSRSLLDESYSREYVNKALTDKGFNSIQIAHILKTGQQQVLESKLKQNRNFLFALAFLWAASIALYMLTEHTTTITSPETGMPVTVNGPGWFALRGFFVLGGLSAFGAIRHFVLFIKAANNEVSK